MKEVWVTESPLGGDHPGKQDNWGRLLWDWGCTQEEHLSCVKVLRFGGCHQNEPILTFPVISCSKIQLLKCLRKPFICARTAIS